MEKKFGQIYFFFAALFIALLPFHPYMGSYVIKVIPIALLAYFGVRYTRGIRGGLLGLGLLFSAMGDIWLDINRVDYFVFGLASFLVGHIFYISVFAVNMEMNKSRFSLIGLLWAFGFGMAYLLATSENVTKDLLLPILVYLLVIITMGSMAALRRMPSSLALAGALSFIVSDSVIAINTFLYPFPVWTITGELKAPIASVIIMFFYYLGQYWITRGTMDKFAGVKSALK